MTTKKSDGPIFGTDGIRGRALEGWLSPTAVEALGRAAGAVLGRSSDGSEGRALIAHDGRASAGPLQGALARGLAQSGIRATTAGLLPTPGLAWLTGSRPVALGAMISASHNPAEDNGIKLFAGGGNKLTDAEQAEIEIRLRDELDRIDPDGADEEPPLERDDSLRSAYADHLVALGSEGEPLDLSGLKIVLDGANGAASTVGPDVLARLGAEVTSLHCVPDGLNINAGCGSTHPESLQAQVREAGASLGIALDGDADRCLLVDERGELVDGDAIMTIIARDAADRGLWTDLRIVATARATGASTGPSPPAESAFMRWAWATAGRRGAPQRGLPRRREVGTHHLRLRERVHRRWPADGAPRAGRGRPQQGGPVHAGGAVRPVPRSSSGSLSPPSRTDTLPEFQALRARFEQELGDDGRVNVRYSGTEPKARVMIEGADALRIEQMAVQLSETLAKEIERG